MIWDYERPDPYEIDDYFDSLLDAGTSSSLDSRIAAVREIEGLFSDSDRRTALRPGLYVDQKPTAGHALGRHSLLLWEEATNTFKAGYFMATVLSTAASLESALKFLLLREKSDQVAQRQFGLGRAINQASEAGILPEFSAEHFWEQLGSEALPLADKNATVAARWVNQYRNDLIHANVERHRPVDALDPEREENTLHYEIVLEGDFDGVWPAEILTGIGYFEARARYALRDAAGVFGHFWPSSNN